MTSANQMLDDHFEESGWRLESPARHDMGMKPTVPNAARVPMWSFESNGDRLSCDRPVQIEIRAEEGGCYASCERLHVFSYGSTVEECLADLNRQVIDFFDSYMALSNDQVSGLAERLHELYATHFERTP